MKTRKDKITGTTREQRQSYKRICKRYEQKPREVFYLFGDALMLVFPFITIGIERDGYAHS